MGEYERAVGVGLGVAIALWSATGGCAPRRSEGGGPGSATMTANEALVDATMKTRSPTTDSPVADAASDGTLPGAKETRPVDPVILIHETQGLPEELIGVRPLWEAHEGPVGSDASNTSRRLYPDGRLFALGRRELVITREHKPKARLGKREWRLAAVVGDVQGVEAAIKAYFLGIPTQDPDRTVVLDGTDFTWTSYLSDGARHRVTRAGNAPHGVMEVEMAIARRILRGAVQVPHVHE